MSFMGYEVVQCSGGFQGQKAAEDIGIPVGFYYKRPRTSGGVGQTGDSFDGRPVSAQSPELVYPERNRAIGQMSTPLKAESSSLICSLGFRSRRTLTINPKDF